MTYTYTGLCGEWNVYLNSAAQTPPLVLHVPEQRCWVLGPDFVELLLFSSSHFQQCYYHRL